MPGAHISDQGYALGQILDTPMYSYLNFQLKTPGRETCRPAKKKKKILPVKDKRGNVHGTLPAVAYLEIHKG